MSKKAIGLIGDVNYLEYGGMVVFADGSVDVVVPDENDEDAPVLIYRFDLDRVAPGSEWFSDDLGKVASYVGRPKADIERDLASDNLMLRAAAYNDVVSYWGLGEFDSEPLSLSPAEAEKRYEKVDRELGELTPNPLLSARDTPKIERLVRSAAATRFGRGKARPFFEHGQWWVDVNGRFYAVVDSRPGVGGLGLDFEATG
jgi:hypothetical protein